MVAVFVTALTTWIILLVLETLNVGNFLVEGTIAVIGGALIGLLVPWYMVRQRRQNR